MSPTQPGAAVKQMLGKAGRETESNRKRETLTGWALVAAQMVLLAIIFLLPWHPARVPAALRVVFVAIAGAGAGMVAWGSLALGRSISPHPAPVEGAILRTGGPYRLVRHPIYSGVLGLGFGAAGASGSMWKWLAFALLAAVLTIKASFEEDLLRRKFEGYDAYARRTPRFLPRPGPAHKPEE